MRELWGYLGHLFPSGRHLSLLGFAIPQIWMWVIAQQPNGISGAPLTCYHVASIATLLLAALLGGKHPQWSPPRWATAVSSVGMALLPLYQTLAPLAALRVPALEVALAILGGAGCAWCFLSWFNVCCATGRRDAVAYLLLSFGAMALCRLVLSLVPPVTVSALISLSSLTLVVLTPFAERVARSREANGQQALSATDAQPGYSVRQKAFVIVELALYSFVLGLMSPASSESQSLTPALVLNYLLRIVFVLVLFAWVSLHDRKEVAHLAQAAFCCTVVVVLALALLGGSASIVAAALLSFARSVVLVLLTVVSVEIAASQRLHPFAVFGVGRATYEAAVLGGTLLTHALPQDLAPVATSLNVIFFVVACFLLLIGTRTIKTVAHMGGTDAAGNKSPETPDGLRSGEKEWKGTISRLASEHGLTARETEILDLLCRGRGKAHIAETLSISENTVRHHSKNIYAKLGVHSREELMDLLPNN